MNNFINRFYFFSKLSTSLILLILLLFISYLFIKAFLNKSNLDVSENMMDDLSRQINSLQTLVERNSNTIEVTNSIIQENKKISKDLKLGLEALNNENIINDFVTQINKINEEYKKLKNELVNISSNIEELSKNTPVSKIKDKSLINPIVDLIELKLNAGLNFSKEIELIEDNKLNLNNTTILEKLSLLAIEKFPGINNITTDFDKIASVYLNDYYLKKNNNYFTKYFLNYVLLEPNIGNNIEDENVLLLSLARKNLLDKKIDESIKILKKLDESDSYFTSWIKKSEYYQEVLILLSRLRN